jgi:hypothetical protein
VRALWFLAFIFDRDANALVQESFFAQAL